MEVIIIETLGYNPKKGVIIMISKDIEINKKEIKDLFHNTSDLILYEFTTACGAQALIAYLDGIIEKLSIN